MNDSATVGRMREQSALCASATPVQIVTKDSALRDYLTTTGLRLIVVRTYPDTVDSDGQWNSTFKVEVQLG